MIVSPNGINVEKFKPRQKSLSQVIVEQTREIVWPAKAPSGADCHKYKRMITFVGKAAEWKMAPARGHEDTAKCGYQKIKTVYFSKF